MSTTATTIKEKPTYTQALIMARKRLESMTFEGEHAEAMSAARYMCMSAIYELANELLEDSFKRVLEILSDPCFEKASSEDQQADDGQPSDEEVKDSDRDDWQAWRSSGGFR